MSSAAPSAARPGWIRIGVLLLVSGPALWHVWLAARVFAGRYAYPFDIDWLESSALYQAWRMMEGQYTYDTPDRGYLPLFHPIGYPALLAGVGKITGLDYAMARLLSIAAVVASLIIGGAQIVLHCRRDRALGITLALLSAGLAGACMPMSGGFYDMVRNDSISWLLCFIAAAIASAPKLDRKRTIGLAVVMVLAVYVRLLVVFPCTWIGFAVLVRDRRAGLHLAAYVIGGCAVVLAFLQWMSNGWYFTYTVTLLQGHALHMDRLRYAVSHIFGQIPFVPFLLLAVMALLSRKHLAHRVRIWLGCFVMAFPAALLPYAKDGGFDNDHMPIGLFIGPAMAMLIVELPRLAKEVPALADQTKPVMVGRYVLAVAWAGFLLLRPYAVERFVPTDEHWKRAAELNRLVSELDGGVISPTHPFLPIRNGHRNDQYSEMPYIDAFWARLPGLKLSPYVEQSGAEWAILTGFEIDSTMAALGDHFHYERKFAGAPATIVGQPLSLKHLMRRRRTADDKVLFDFEQPLSGWRVTGLAFANSPTSTKPSWQNRIFGARGDGVLNSYHPKFGDRAKGHVVSPTFTIDGDLLTMRIGGGGGVGVNLQVGGRSVRGANVVMHNRELLVPVAIDVRKYRGKEARLMFYDNNDGAWGHLLVDDVAIANDVGTPVDVRMPGKMPARGTRRLVP